MESYYTRRELFLGGLTLGAALAGGLLLTGSSRWMQQADATRSGDNHRQLALPWNGLDFVWLPDNNRLAIASASGLGIVETSKGYLNWQQWPVMDASQHGVSGPRVISWSSDGTRVMSLLAMTVQVLDVLSGRLLWSRHIDQAASVALSPNGTYLAIAPSSVQPSRPNANANVQIWNVSEGRLAFQSGAHGPSPRVVKSILWSPDNTRIATTSQEGTVQVWRVADGLRLWSASAGGSQQAISWSPDGSTIAFVAGGMDGQARLGLWDAHSGEQRFQTPALVGFLSDLRDDQVAWSPDGTRISFSVQARDGSLIEVWSTQSGRRLFTCQAVSGQSPVPTWSPDGRYIAAGQTIVGGGEMVRGDNGDRSVIQFWDARNGNALFTYSAPKSPQSLTWSPDSRSLAIITPRVYGALANSTCLSLCRYGYSDYALEVYRVV